MPTYSYRGFNTQGQKIGGSLQCATRAELEAKINTQGIADYEIYESKTQYDTRPYALVKPDDLAFICREISVMLRSNMIPAEGLALLAGQSTNLQLKLALSEISEFIARGHTLAGAFSMYDHIFGAFLTRMAAAGETSGQLKTAFAELADFYDQEAGFRHKLRTCILFPMIRMVLLWSGVFLIISHALPMIASLLDDMNMSQPFAFKTARFVYAYGWVAAVVILLCAGLVILLARFPRSRSWLDAQLLSLPVVRSICLPLCTYRLSRGVALMLKHGVPLSGSESCLRVLVRNYGMEAKSANVIRRIDAGQDVPAVLESVRHFPPVFPVVFYNMLLSGHHTGKMTDMLENAGHWFETEANYIINRDAAFLEPLLLWLLALAAGWPLLAMLLPLINAMGV